MPPLSARVNDGAGLLPPARAAALERKLEGFERETSHQVVLLTVPSLGDEPIEDFSMRVAEAWKIGHSGLDNGVIVLVAPRERKVRIEVGYGLEGVIPDAIASRIIRERMTPLFAEGRMADGIEAGLDAVMAAARGEEIPAERRPHGGPGGGSDPLGVVLFAAFASLFLGAPFRAGAWRALGGLVGAGVAGAITWLLLGLWPWAPLAALLGGLLGAIGPAAGMGGGRRGYGGPWGGWGGGGWGGGGGSGGGFSGGGGGFGGGGASGSW